MYKFGIKKWIIALLFMLILGIGFTLLFPLAPRKDYTTAKNTYNTYCGSCHITPDPTKIPKSFWEHNVLPEMARRMGYGNLNNSLYPYPETPIIDSIQWNQIHDYVINLAPDNIPNIPFRKGRGTELSQFHSSLQILANPKTSGAITNSKYDAASGYLFMANAYGQVREWKNRVPIKGHFNSPIISTVFKEDTTYLTEIGLMKPSETAQGTLYMMKNGVMTPIFRKLHRPVYTEINDLDEDGKNEILICEFGNYTGELSILIQKGGVYKKRTLLNLPGSIKVEVVDMNKDGKKDIAALFSQGREGIYIFYQKENLQFDIEKVISLEPEYGSSWFSLLDYNKDGKLDIVMANGDNADYSDFLKPYHGIRLYINEGGNTFEQKWFYPINGATRVLAEDFDLDGDLDFAVSAFFPDFKNAPEEGFVYLENKDAANYTFLPQVTQKAEKGNWLVMDKGDFDRDGDIDLMLGSFSLQTSDKLKAGSKYDLLYLENKAVKN
ncbi:FG-GAP repeat domain-containing protein [Flavimarina sp. Hel_I_48]|uniref:FG-GAP repeat domain-containing protein n=1 Tax=Flavimarina sp. Hel_I_48 TaxID=1392488 RepID=UPI00068BC5BB|nr:VCBS repeat-containing protein [Flavimarina sp. Hel_I_48]